MKYEPRETIKAQAFTDFIAELPQGTKELSCLNNPVWTLHVDEATGIETQGDRLVLKGPKGMEVSKVVKFSFPVTNNIVKYKSLILGLELARKTDVQSLKAYSDSNLLVQ